MEDHKPERVYLRFLLNNAFGTFQDFRRVEYNPVEDADFGGEDVSPVIRYFRQAKGAVEYPAPSEDVWRRFRERLDALGVFEWKSRPIAGEDEDALDWMPPSWNIQITYPDRAIDIKGPIDELPPHGTSKPGVEFRQFCEAVSELIGGREFGQDIL